MNDAEKESDLVNRVNSAMGPAQKLVALRELSNLYKLESETSTKLKDKHLEILHKCLEISNADPSLWHEFGEVSFSIGRMPLALYSFYSASTLSPSPSYLCSYSLCLALTHDYINALSLANYLISTYDYEDAKKVRDYARFRLYGIGTDTEIHKVIWKDLSEVPKPKIKKVSNLYSLCSSVRKLASNKDGDSYTFDKDDTGVSKQKKENKFQLPDCKYWDVIEKYKIKVFEMTGFLCYGFLSSKIFQQHFVSSKATALFEPEIKNFFGVPLTYRKLASELIKLLCKNSPRPSTLLSGEVASEIIKIYSLCKDFLRFEDEYLTLLEISIKESKSDLILDLRNNLIQYYKPINELNIRCYTAMAYSYFKTRDNYEKTQEGLLRQLYNADVYLSKAIDEIADTCLYLWWSDTIITIKELDKLKFDIKIDLELIQIDKAIKTSSRLASSALSLLERLTKILAYSHRYDDPIFYWRKIKIILKNISKFSLQTSEYEVLGQCFSRYVAVLLYNFEDGVKVTNEHDIKGLFNMLTDNMNYGLLSLATKAQLIGSTINLFRHCAKNFHQIPFYFKKVFKGLDSSYLEQVFNDFHELLYPMEKHSDSKFHLSLCKSFEKSCFLAESSSRNIIYSWLYGIGSKRCSCKASYPSTILTLPNSSNKLLRILTFLQKDWKGTVEFPSDPAALNLLTELYNKEPRYFVGCKVLEINKIEEFGDLKEIHVRCCPEGPRETAKKGYKRLAMELIQSAIKTDLKESVKNLKMSLEVLQHALYLDPSDCETWGLIGSSHMWKWVLGYFDLIITLENLQAAEENFETSLFCFNKALTSASDCLQRYCLEARASLLYLKTFLDKNFLSQALEYLESDVYTPKTQYIKNLLRYKNKQEVCSEYFQENIPLCWKILYKNTGNEELLKKLIECKDPVGLYYAFKIQGNWKEAITSNFLTIKFQQNDILLDRQNFLWKLKKKAAERCLELFKSTNDIESIQILIAKYSSLCVRGRKNKVIVEVINKSIKTLVELDKKEIALQELDKNSILNIKEKQALKIEINVEINN
jgi:hypothetical protein